MWKPVVVAAAALAIGGSSIVYAQQHSGGSGGYGDGGPRFEQHHRLSAEDMVAFTDARRRAKGRPRAHARSGEKLAGV